mmetsp:Transcript_108587/g.132521  ORF Transcript_108587/g.132521 Transcript_108587/m.132521 type:complete len:137 (-) Transcript_108587:602-1012(-)
MAWVLLRLFHLEVQLPETRHPCVEPHELEHVVLQALDHPQHEVMKQTRVPLMGQDAHAHSRGSGAQNRDLCLEARPLPGELLEQERVELQLEYHVHPLQPLQAKAPPGVKKPPQVLLYHAHTYQGGHFCGHLCGHL